MWRESVRTIIPRCLAVALFAGLLSQAGALPAAQASPVLSTAFPGIEVQPGQSVGFPLTVAESGSSGEIVSLSVGSAPHGWQARLKGSGYAVDEAYISPGTAGEQNPTLQVKVPAGAKAGTYHLTVTASGPGGTSTLPLQVRVTGGRTAKPTLTAQYPELQGPSKAKYQFQLTLTNNGLRNASFALSDQAPKGWQVDFTPGFSSKQIGAIPVKSGNSQTIDVNVNPPASAPAGTYKVVATATAGAGQTVSVPLRVHLLGSYQLNLTTPSGRLNASGTAGATSTTALLLQNTGSAPLRNVSLSANAPNNWNVTFKPDRINALPAGSSQQVTMTVRPGSNAIAGDYDVSVSANTPATSATQDIRYTVGASTLWGWIGVLVVLAVIAGLGYLFRRLGRR